MELTAPGAQAGGQLSQGAKEHMSPDFTPEEAGGAMPAVRLMPPIGLAGDVGKAPKDAATARVVSVGDAAGAVEGVEGVVERYQEERNRLAGQLREVEATLVDHLHRLPPIPHARSSSSTNAPDPSGDGRAREKGDRRDTGTEEGAVRQLNEEDGEAGGASFQEQLRTIDAKLLSAKERIKRKTNLATAASAASQVTNDCASTPAVDAGTITVPKAEYDALEEEKTKIEEELWELKFQYEEEQRKVFALSSEKEALEQYVTQLAEEMQKETANMVSMKEQFEEQASPAGRKSARKAPGAGNGGTGLEGASALALLGGSEASDGSGITIGGGGGGEAGAGGTIMDAQTLAVELALKDEELSRLRDLVGRETRKMEGQIVSLKFDLQKARNEVNVREGKMASIKLELEKGRKRMEAIELEKRTLEDDLARAHTALARSEDLRLQAQAAERTAQAEREDLQQRMTAADAELVRLREVHEEATRALAAHAHATASPRDAIKQVEDRVASLQQEWAQLRERERDAEFQSSRMSTGGHGDSADAARWAVEEFVRELQARVAGLEREREEERSLRRDVKDELQRRIRKLEREKEEEKARGHEAQERLREAQEQLQHAVAEGEKDREDRRKAEAASAQLTERLAQYEALGRGEVERGQHLFLERERELRQAIDDKESQRRKIEAEAIMLRVEVQRAQAQAAQADHLAAELAQAREHLSQAQQRETEYQARVASLEELVRSWEERHNPQIREREAAEARAKDRRIAQLSADLAAQTQAAAGQQELHDQSLQALKTQHSLLSRELARLEEQQAEMVKEKDETIQHLQSELQSLRQAYKTLAQQHNSPSTARREEEKDATLTALRQELDHVKQELFYSTAVGIKLNLTYSGRSCNINIGSLYEKALAEDIKWNRWNSWIHDQAEGKHSKRPGQ